MLQYKGPNQQNFTDVTGTLHIVRTTTVTFRNGPTGVPADHTFNTRSSSSTTPVTVHPCGATAPSVSAIVFSLVPKTKPRDNFGGRSKTELGVNERVYLTFSTQPEGITAVEAGGLEWEIASGALGSTMYGKFNGDRERMLRGKVQRERTNESAPLQDGKAFFKAPWATDEQSPLAPRPSAKTRKSILRLVVKTGPSTGKFKDVEFTVHTPTARMVATPNEIHENGKPSAGFHGDVFYDPKDVSFHYIKWREGRGTQLAKQTGFKQAMNFGHVGKPPEISTPPSGYFAHESGRVHDQGGWMDVWKGDISKGCEIGTSDRVFSGWNARWPAKYIETDGVNLKGKETDVPSEVSWPIYWKYRPEEIHTHEVVAQQVTHKAVMDAAGKVTISKAGASVSKNLNDPTQAG